MWCRGCAKCEQIDYFKYLAINNYKILPVSIFLLKVIQKMKPWYRGNGMRLKSEQLA